MLRYDFCEKTLCHTCFCVVWLAPNQVGSEKFWVSLFLASLSTFGVLSSIFSPPYPQNVKEDHLWNIISVIGHSGLCSCMELYVETWLRGL